MTLPSSPPHHSSKDRCSKDRSSENSPAQDDASLEQALTKSQMQQKKLNQLTFAMAVIMAIFISLIVANQNLYSMATTFIAALIFLLAASVYQRSMLLLTPLILLYSLADNFLSHGMQFHQARLTLQVAALIIFTGIFYLSRRSLLNVIRALDKPE